MILLYYFSSDTILHIKNINKNKGKNRLLNNSAKRKKKVKVTVQTCQDADRLDFDRVGIKPSPKYRHTDATKALPMLAGVGLAAQYYLPYG